MAKGSSGEGSAASAGGLIGIIIAGFLFLPLLNAYTAWNMVRAAQTEIQFWGRAILFVALWLAGLRIWGKDFLTFQDAGLTGAEYGNAVFLMLRIGAAIFVAQWILFFVTGGKWREISPYISRLPGLKK